MCDADRQVLVGEITTKCDCRLQVDVKCNSRNDIAVWLQCDSEWTCVLCWLTRSASAEMTLPRVVNDLLMLAPSLSLAPLAPVLSARSLPAKSTRLILLTWQHPVRHRRSATNTDSHDKHVDKWTTNKTVCTRWQGCLSTTPVTQCWHTSLDYSWQWVAVIQPSTHKGNRIRYLLLTTANDSRAAHSGFVCCTNLTRKMTIKRQNDKRLKWRRWRRLDKYTLDRIVSFISS